MIKLYKDIITTAFLAALASLFSAYIVGGFNGLTIAVVAASAATISVIKSFVLTKINYES